MEVNGEGLLDELLSVGAGRETWETHPGLFPTMTSWGFDDGNPAAVAPPPLPVLPHSYDCFSGGCIKPDLEYGSFYSTPYDYEPNSNLAGFAAGDYSYSMCVIEDNKSSSLEEIQAAAASCKLESTGVQVQPTSTSTSTCGAFNFNTGLGLGLCAERKNSKVVKAGKVQGQPSKNLMAERRRRKRLNDRLSMLRSVVPKISKMDRTSILGDTIDYMKELLERINHLQEEMEGKDEVSIFKELRQNDTLPVRNSPKFDVERRDSHTRIEMSCSGKQGLLLSSVSALEALGLEIQQCVITCFNDFSLHAACSEDLEQTALVSAEEIKQQLFRTAGYGGRCL